MSPSVVPLSVRMYVCILCVSLNMYPCVCLSLSAYIHECLSVFLTFSLSLFNSLFACTHVCVSLSISLFPSLFSALFLSLYVCVCVCVSISSSRTTPLTRMHSQVTRQWNLDHLVDGVGDAGTVEADSQRVVFATCNT